MLLLHHLRPSSDRVLRDSNTLVVNLVSEELFQGFHPHHGVPALLRAVDAVEADAIGAGERRLDRKATDRTDAGSQVRGTMEGQEDSCEASMTDTSLRSTIL